MRPWHNVEFRGNYVHDFLSAAATEETVRYIVADTSHAGGVRVRFLSGATYANFVKILDIMSYTREKKYWLDIRRYPVTLYAITDRVEKIAPSFSCGTRSLEARLRPGSGRVGLQAWLVNFRECLLSLLNQPWQVSTLLLAILSALSLRRLIRPEFSRHNL